MKIVAQRTTGIVMIQYGYNFVVNNPLEVRTLGGGRREAERLQAEEQDSLIWSRLGRGE